MGIAVFYALVIKKPDDASEAESGNELSSDEEWLHKHLTEKDLLNPETLRILENRKANAPLPPEYDFLHTAKAERSGCLNFRNRNSISPPVLLQVQKKISLKYHSVFLPSIFSIFNVELCKNQLRIQQNIRMLIFRIPVCISNNP